MYNQLNELPFSLKQVKGQNTALRYLDNYAKYPNKIPPLLIFHGPTGVGKYFAAERFIKTILCSEGSACGICVSCRLFAKRSHPDFIEFPVESNIAIGETTNPKEFTIRWLVNQKIVYSPTQSNLRFVLIPDATRINHEAETALLKSLEEAPHHTRFIFLVEDYKDIKQTITSRAVMIPFRYIPKSIMLELTKEQNTFYQEFNGGSFDLNYIESETWEEYINIVNNSIYDSIQLIELELWINSQKAKESKWKKEFDYKVFLETITSLMIRSYYIDRKKYWEESIELIYFFKEKFHENIPGMDSIILSRMFHKLNQLHT